MFDRPFSESSENESSLGLFKFCCRALVALKTQHTTVIHVVAHVAVHVVLYVVVHVLIHVVVHALVYVVVHVVLYVVAHLLVYVVVHVLIHVVVQVLIHVVLHISIHVLVHVVVHCTGYNNNYSINSQAMHTLHPVDITRSCAVNNNNIYSQCRVVFSQ